MTASEVCFPQKAPSLDLGTSLQGTQYDSELFRVTPSACLDMLSCVLTDLPSHYSLWLCADPGPEDPASHDRGDGR